MLARNIVATQKDTHLSFHSLYQAYISVLVSTNELEDELLLVVEILDVEFVMFVKFDELMIELDDIEELQLEDGSQDVDVGSPQTPNSG